MRLTLDFELSKKEIELLKYIKEFGYAEYRDVPYYSYEEYLEDDNGSSVRTEEWFNARNSNATFKEAERLSFLGLLISEPDSWHTSYILSDIGRILLEQNEI